MSADGIMEKRLREALKKLGAIIELSTKTSVDGGDFSDALAKAKDVLALPKTQAEKQAEVLLELLDASNAFCPDGYVLYTGNSEAMLHFKTKLRACREAGLE